MHDFDDTRLIGSCPSCRKSFRVAAGKKPPAVCPECRPPASGAAPRSALDELAADVSDIQSSPPAVGRAPRRAAPRTWSAAQQIVRGLGILSVGFVVIAIIAAAYFGGGVHVGNGVLGFVCAMILLASLDAIRATLREILDELRRYDPDE